VRSAHACDVCRRFLTRWGGLVSIDARGGQHSLWEVDAPGVYAPAARALSAAVRRRPVSGVFYSAGATLGRPGTPEYPHLHLRLPAACVRADPSQAVARAESRFFQYAYPVFSKLTPFLLRDNN